MPQPSNIYASSRVAVLAIKLLSEDKFLRLIESASIVDALKVLSESSYGGGTALEKPSDFEKLLQIEEQNLCDLIKEVTPDQNATDCFLCVYDYNNAKILMKSKYLRLKDISFLSDNGLINPLELKERILNDNYVELPVEMAEACLKIDQSFADGNRSPTVIDNLLDLALVKDRLKKSKASHSESIRDYFKTSAELSNILMLFRMKKAKLGKAELEKVFIFDENAKITLNDNGEAFNRNAFIDLIEQSDENILKYFSMTPDKALVEMSCELLKNDKSLVESEIWVDNFIKSKISILKNESEKIEPLINYFLCKLAEIKNVRLILVGLKNGVDKQLLRERLRDIYA